MAEAGDLFHNKTHPTNLPCFETTLLFTSPFQLKHSPAAPPKRWIPPSPMSRDQGTFTVSRWRTQMSHAVATSPILAPRPWAHGFHTSHWAARWTCSWHFSNQKTGFDHQQWWLVSGSIYIYKFHDVSGSKWFEPLRTSNEFYMAMKNLQKPWVLCKARSILPVARRMGQAKKLSENSCKMV